MFFSSAPGAIFLDIQGISGTLDPWFYEWLTYTPISKVSNLSSVTPSGGEAKLKVIDTSMADATSPLKDRGTSQGRLNKFQYSIEILIIHIMVTVFLLLFDETVYHFTFFCFYFKALRLGVIPLCQQIHLLTSVLLPKLSQGHKN